MSRRQTDSSHFAAKVKLRLANLPEGQCLRVLDCFCGNGTVWREVARLSGRQIKVIGIDKKRDCRGVYLVGDTRKFLPALDLARFDIIDIDAYGIAGDLMCDILPLCNKQIIFVTAIQVAFGALPRTFLARLGYTATMIGAIPSLFNRRGREKILGFLSTFGISRAIIYSAAKQRKNYICCSLKGMPNVYDLRTERPG